MLCLLCFCFTILCMVRLTNISPFAAMLQQVVPPAEATTLHAALFPCSHRDCLTAGRNDCTSEYPCHTTVAPFTLTYSTMHHIIHCTLFTSLCLLHPLHPAAHHKWPTDPSHKLSYQVSGECVEDVSLDGIFPSVGLDVHLDGIICFALGQQHSLCCAPLFAQLG